MIKNGVIWRSIASSEGVKYAKIRKKARKTAAFCVKNNAIYVFSRIFLTLGRYLLIFLSFFSFFRVVFTVFLIYLCCFFVFALYRGFNVVFLYRAFLRC